MYRTIADSPANDYVVHGKWLAEPKILATERGVVLSEINYFYLRLYDLQIWILDSLIACLESGLLPLDLRADNIVTFLKDNRLIFKHIDVDDWYCCRQARVGVAIANRGL